ncbi:MAG: nucleoside triphosphate pyrophosphohydrolase [Clostridia bacterium]|nr:nucleoside triphosphate pyrophosphohydrolase [Clostridia bacterium]
MKKITVVGLGPGDLGLLTLEVWNRLTRAEKVYLRTANHPVVEQLSQQGIKWESFDWIYEKEDNFELVYAKITTELLGLADKRDIFYGVPGHPLVAETTVKLILEQGEKLGLEVELVPGMSFLDVCYNILKIDPAEGLVIHDALVTTANQLVTNKGQLFCQVYNGMVASELKLTLMDKLPDDFLVWVITGAGIPGMEQVQQVPLYQLDRLKEINHLTSIYVPPEIKEQTDGSQEEEKTRLEYTLEPIVNVMEELRSETGCPWDREQTHSSLKKYLIEEAYEVIEAIEEKNMYNLCDELGDLLLQIVFHAQIAKEKKHFNINDVVEAITTKMVRRHPHVFGQGMVQSSDEVLKNWEQIKKEEQGEQEGEKKTFLRVPAGLPGLMKSQKLQQQAARVGFDWPDMTGVMAKIKEEWQELAEAIDSGDEEQINEEFGDVLFALVNLARFLKIDAEEVLQQTCTKFTLRFRMMEQEVGEKKLDLGELNLVELENLWENAKKCLKMRK